ncbi:MAG TPA: hypothetical protein PLZ98_08505, partial [Chitinophagaceae bacterium]|nr:hypothetical protein [Chitinophagaceae bacterium]
LLINNSQIDSSSKTGFNYEIIHGDSSITLLGNYISSGFDLYDTDQLISDSVVTSEGKLVVTVLPSLSGKRQVTYKSITNPKTITPTYSKTSIQYGNAKVAQSRNEHLISTFNGSEKDVSSRLNYYILAVFFIAAILFFIFLIYKYLKK